MITYSLLPPMILQPSLSSRYWILPIVRVFGMNTASQQFDKIF